MKSGKKTKTQERRREKKKMGELETGSKQQEPKKKKKKKRTSPGQTSFSALVLPWLPHVDRAAVTSPTDQT